MLGDLFGNKATQDKATQDKAQGKNEAQSGADTQSEGVGDILGEVKQRETPQSRMIKIKTANGTQAEITYISSGDAKSIEQGLKAICEAVLNGEITAEKSEEAK